MSEWESVQHGMIEKICARTGCSYAEAKKSLQQVEKEATQIIAGVVVRAAYRRVMGQDLPENN